jgi:CDP-diacylglycerol--glycerol-3-phosphate 3-phosphatidyltransferase
MNLATKLTFFRVYMTLLLLVIMVFPFDSVGIVIPKLFINESLVVDMRYIISGVLFVIASFTDFLDGYVARKYNMVTDFGKMFDAIADKVLVNSVLILLSASGFVHPIITVIIITRDSITNAIKMAVGNKKAVVAASKTAKIKTITLMMGISLTLFYNLPFELYNLRVSDFLLIVAAILSIISGIEYYKVNKEFIFEKKEIKENI